MYSVKKSFIELAETHKVNFNLFSIFVGPPTSAKSPAIKYAVTEAMKDIPDLNIFSYAIDTIGINKKTCQAESGIYC